MVYSQHPSEESGVELLRCKLEMLNQKKYLESLDIIDSILNATVGHILYERVDMDGLRIPIVDKHRPLTNKYVPNHLNLRNSRFYIVISCVI